MTFTVATTRQPCKFPGIVILSGPLLTFGLAYAGMLLLGVRKRARLAKYALFAYALIFASFAHLRFIQTLSGGGDELVLARGWSPALSRAGVAAIVLLIGVPPLAAGFRAIANQRRGLVFAASWLLPVPLLVLLLLGDKYLFETTAVGAKFGSFAGIWLTVLVSDLAAFLLFILLGRRYLRARDLRGA